MPQPEGLIPGCGYWFASSQSRSDSIKYTAGQVIQWAFGGEHVFGKPCLLAAPEKITSGVFSLKFLLHDSGENPPASPGPGCAKKDV